MPKSNTPTLAAALASLSVFLCTGAHATNITATLDSAFSFAATSHFASARPIATKTVKTTTKSRKTVRRGKLVHMRLPANRGGDRFGRLAHFRTMNDDARTGASWSGKTHAATNGSTSAGSPGWTSPNPEEPAFGSGNSQLGLASIATDAPTLLPPGRESNYKVSFNLPVGRNESVNLQAGIRKNAFNIPGSNDPSLHAAWSMRY